MAITVEAVYENGVLKPSQPLPWKEGERVLIDVSSLDSPLLKAYGIMGFKGTAEEAWFGRLAPGAGNGLAGHVRLEPVTRIHEGYSFNRKAVRVTIKGHVPAREPSAVAMPGR